MSEWWYLWKMFALKTLVCYRYWWQARTWWSFWDQRWTWWARVAWSEWLTWTAGEVLLLDCYFLCLFFFLCIVNWRTAINSRETFDYEMSLCASMSQKLLLIVATVLSLKSYGYSTFLECGEQNILLFCPVIIGCHDFLLFQEHKEENIEQM